MKKHILSRIALALVCSLSLIHLNTVNVFAENPYGIVYSGGELLGAANVNTSPEAAAMIAGLSMLVNGGDVDFEVSDSDLWKDGYIKNIIASCRRVKYLSIQRNGQISADDNLYYTFSNNDYTVLVEIKNIVLENFEATDKSLALAVRANGISGGYAIYSQSDCSSSSLVPGFVRLDSVASAKMFFHVNVKLYRYGSDDAFIANGVYFALKDIDARQSYQIRNETNQLSPDNMYAVSADDLQPAVGSARNMFVRSTTEDDRSYIYSQVSLNLRNSDIFVKLNNVTQQEGLDFVFGFGQSAGSSIEFYAHQYTVIFRSDEYGCESGTPTDDICEPESSHDGFGRQVVSGSSPGISYDVPIEGYELTHWVADVDVRLSDGTTILAGTPMTMEQIENIVVEQNITFTAYHASISEEPDEPTAPEVPDSGVFTSSSEMTGAAMYGAGVILLVSYMLVRLFARRSGQC